MFLLMAFIVLILIVFLLVETLFSFSLTPSGIFVSLNFFFFSYINEKLFLVKKPIYRNLTYLPPLIMKSSPSIKLQRNFFKNWIPETMLFRVPSQWQSKYLTGIKSTLQLKLLAISQSCNYDLVRIMINWESFL